MTPCRSSNLPPAPKEVINIMDALKESMQAKGRAKVPSASVAAVAAMADKLHH
jgi:hypothetical protein